MSLNKFSLRELRARPTRVLLTFLSIAIGVGAVVAVLLATGTTRSAQREMLQAVSGQADLEIISDSNAGFPYQRLETIRATPGVRLAAPSLNRFATLFAGDRKARTQVLGIDPRIDQEIRDYQLLEGRLPQSFDEILLDNSFSKSLAIRIGDTVKLLGAGGLEEFKLVGLVRPGGSSAVTLGGAAYLVLPSAQRVFRASQKLDQVLVLVDPGADVAVITSRLKSELQEGVTVRQPQTSSDMAREMMYATENGLHMAIAFALLIATFIIYNTFQMAVGERRKQLGILRAVGATRQQVSRMILREALLISVFGAAAGCVFGYWGAGFLNSATQGVLQVELPRVQLELWPFLLAVALGMGVAWLGAWMPAKRASSVQPIEAMRAIELEHNDEVIRLTKPFGIVAIPLGLVFLYLAVSGWLPIGADVVAVVLVLLGCVLIIPAILQTVSLRLVSWLSPWLGVESRLAQKQLTRHVGRSTLTIGVLFIAVSTSIGMAGNILDNVDNIRSWYSRAIIGDFFIRASMPDFATGSAADIPDSVATELQSTEGIAKLQPMRFVTAQTGDNSVLVVARGFTGPANDYFDLVGTPDVDIVQELRAGKVVIGSVLGERMQLARGGLFPLETDAGTVELEIAAVANDYLAGGLTVYMQLEKASELLNANGTSVYVVTAKAGKRESLQRSLQALCDSNGLILQSYAELVQLIDKMVNGVIASLWMLLALGCVIAAMGLVNTLTMNILEQTREIGMLRVIAMTRSQVRRMVFAQAALLGIIGIMPGALAGIFVAFAISQSAMAVLGHDIAYQFRPGLTLGCVGFGMLMVLVSSLIPAERAARLKIAAALQYE